jgi:hypothetical protein
MTNEVGMLFGAPDVVNVRLLMRLIASDWPAGTVISGGCHVPGDDGFSAVHETPVPETAPQV